MNVKKLGYIIVAFVFAAYFIPSQAVAQEGNHDALLGTWEIKQEGRRGVQKSKLIFEMKDNKLVGTFEAIRGQGGGGRGGRGGGGPMEMGDIKFDGTKLSFAVVRETQRGEITITYAATIKGDKIEGESETSFGGGGGGGRGRGPSEFSGKKIK